MESQTHFFPLLKDGRGETNPTARSGTAPSGIARKLLNPQVTNRGVQNGYTIRQKKRKEKKRQKHEKRVDFTAHPHPLICFLTVPTFCCDDTQTPTRSVKKLLGGMAVIISPSGENLTHPSH